MSCSIVVIDDEQAMCELISALLTPLGFEVRWFTDAPSGLAHIRHHPVSAVLTDVRMPKLSGLELCKRVHDCKPALPVVLMTGFGSMETAVEAIRAGAYDFISKPVELDALELVVRRAVDHSALTEELDRLSGTDVSGEHLGLIGSSAVFKRAMSLIPRAARADVPVLLQGETGTGKELLARALHNESSRRDEPFVVVNCAAIPESLVESELFGHVAGAFTDAKGGRAGLFVEAGRGTLFLDEVAELSPAVQPKLLRVLQEQRIRPVGSDREQSVHCRVLTATHADLKRACLNGTFRADLYYRVAVIRLDVPPLRERSEDILQLAQHFLYRSAERMSSPVTGLSKEAAQALVSYSWPGNIRELKNAMERAVALAEGECVALDDLPEEICDSAPEAELGAVASLPTLAELEEAHIKRVLGATQGNKKAAAKILGLDRRTLYRKLERFGEEP